MAKRPLHVTRRELLQTAGWAMAATALSPHPARTAAQEGAAGQPVGHVMKTLSAYMSEAKNRALPDPVLERAKRHTLDTLAAMLKKRPFEADQVQEVIVRMAPGNVTDNRDMPDVNIQHMIAVMLIDKTASFQAAHDVPRMKDPTILRHRAKVRLVAPQGRGGGGQPLVQVRLADGSTLAEDVVAVLGTVGNPMTRDQVVAKCRALVTPIVGAAGGTKLIDTILALDTVKDIRTLRPLLQRA